uniref:Glutathione s-transferase D2 n=1 Tax=Sogatella furcifera TaxID=113103 RepID=J9Q5H6_SOGFU|nr:glutathione s-transferase D2 [Sogatella furcifera]
MPIDLYYVPGSAPCRNVLLAAKAVGVDLNLKLTDLKSGQHLTPEFIKLNPQHNVPTLDDNGFVLNESRAIMTYLADQYGKDDSLYPKDPKKRAKVNQRLYFDMGTLYQSFGDAYYPHMFGGAPLEEEKKKKLGDALVFLDGFLEKSPFVAGENLTLADLAIVASISTIEAVEYDLSPYKNINSWYAKVKAAAPGYKEANEEGSKAFGQMFKAMTGK